jgi:hypothetical protein
VEAPLSFCVSEFVDVDPTDLPGATEFTAVVSFDCVALEVSDGAFRMSSVGIGVGVGDVDGFAVGMAEGLVGVVFALASKRLSRAAFSRSASIGWVNEITIFPAGSMTYTVGVSLVMYNFLRLSPPVKIGHLIPVELTYEVFIVSAAAPVVSTLRNWTLASPLLMLL